MTRMLFVAAIALAQTSGISVHAADVSAQIKSIIGGGIIRFSCTD